MKSRSLDPLRLDVAALARDRAELSGHWPLSELARLTGTCLTEAGEDASAAAQWRVVAEPFKGAGGQLVPRLHLSGQVRVTMTCQRCLQAMPVVLDIARVYRFVQDEATAAESDMDSDDDLLALTRSLDLRELLEDEFVLALPLVAKHDHCLTTLARQDGEPLADAPPERPNPFAALAALKKSGGG